MKFLFVSLCTTLVHLVASERDVFVQTGSVGVDSAVVMTRCNTEQNSLVTISYTSTQRHVFPEKRVVTQALVDTDFTVSVQLEGLMANNKYEYRVTCEAIDGSTFPVHSARATFWTAPSPDEAIDVSFVWAADLAGQGWGRNPELSILSDVTGDEVVGGYVVFEVMRSMKPDFAIFQGDMIYADNAIPASKAIPDAVGGGIWYNEPSLDFAAVTLDEFRANWKYNYNDEKMQSFLEEVPVYNQWDDHEVTNNWWPGEILGPPLYPEGTKADSMFVNALVSFYEFNPIIENELIYRSQQYGKHLEVFFLDMRSYREPNTNNFDPNGIDMMGPVQLKWLQDGLLKSTATWKIISMHDPVGLVTGGAGDYDSWGQNDAAILGRELELQALLAFIKANNIENMVMLTSDVHFAAVTSYDPARATFKGFNMFYEFCIGPIHAGAFGFQNLDPSFGPNYDYVRAPSTEGLPANLPPPNLSSFGHVSISSAGVMMMSIIDVTGKPLYTKEFIPAVNTGGNTSGGKKPTGKNGKKKIGGK